MMATDSFEDQLAKALVKPEVRQKLAKAMEEQRATTAPIVSAIQQMEQTEVLEDILNELRDINSGDVLEQVVVDVGPGTMELTQSNVVTMPWKSITVYSDGPADFFVAVNRNYFVQPSAPVRKGQPFIISMKKDGIKKILLTTTDPFSHVAGTGGAHVRLFAIK